ncbi:hypothetical protein NLX83_22040 [Allokutzneria sp. A3M-2-11 16]|uniref:hypothetical protein n=1 Tax=Allokutzneria sp. A3M-2-11 16 TaxID=2962043 RepID=UPI0020B8A149|nr:hypothetical protein [Allokutzneria sp. A3M-2-11 16]MCP3801952.1 hypothetical protein [Allokutzneria sp. A3M-2-11 16]
MTQIKVWHRWRHRSVGGPWDIRKADARLLGQLMDEAKEHHLSAVGRPGWFRDHESEIVDVAVKFWGPDYSPVLSLRCHMAVLLRSDTVRWFGVDILPSRYFTLKRMSQAEVRRWMGMLLYCAPHQPLDPEQGPAVLGAHDDPCAKTMAQHRAKVH